MENLSTPFSFGLLMLAFLSFVLFVMKTMLSLSITPIKESIARIENSLSIVKNNLTNHVTDTDMKINLLLKDRGIEIPKKTASNETALPS